MKTFKLKYLFNSKKGTHREKNQDRLLIIEKKNYYLFMLFDGVSSDPKSYLFINEYKKNIKLEINNNPFFEKKIDEILFETNRKIINSGLEGKSTLSVLIFNNETKEIKFLSIGDSRIYIFTNQFLEKITQDDSLMERSNIITKFLGLDTLILDDFKMDSVNGKYNYLMCTDGFYSLMESQLKDYFEAFNLKYFRSIEKKIFSLQRSNNRDDSTYILIKNEI